MSKWQPVEFLKAFNPSRAQTFAIKAQDRCIVGDAPSLIVMNDAYNENFTTAWLMIQLIQLNKNVLGRNPEKKMTPEQMKTCAQTIISNYGFLKCTDIMLFFVRFMGGKHGKFYGSVDIVQLCSSLDDYCNWRTEQIARIQKEKEKEKVKAWQDQLKADEKHEKFITLEEWENSFEGQEARMKLTEKEIKLVNQFAFYFK